ncbi:MAG: hypothetical protein GY719_06525 [bacterium]|nr:hypothetical protein [bacterium]
MSPKRWHRFKNVVAAVLERDRREWPERLLSECGDDVDLFLDASCLLAHSRSAGDFIRAPAWRALISPAFRSTEANR